MTITIVRRAEWEATDIFHSNILVFWIKRNLWLSLTIFVCNTHSQTCTWWNWGTFIQVEESKAVWSNNDVWKTSYLLFSGQETNHPNVISRDVDCWVREGYFLFPYLLPQSDLFYCLSHWDVGEREPEMGVSVEKFCWRFFPCIQSQESMCLRMKGFCSLLGHKDFLPDKHLLFFFFFSR